MKDNPGVKRRVQNNDSSYTTRERGTSSIIQTVPDRNIDTVTDVSEWDGS